MQRCIFSPLLLAAAGWVFGSCLLYTDPINRPPERPQIMRIAGQSRNMPIVFRASATDPDGDRLLFEWTRTVVGDAVKDCPPEPTADMMPAQTVYSGPTFQVTATDLSPFCVWLRAIDTSGARSLPGTLLAAAINAPPIAVLDRQQPGGNQLAAFPLYSTFRFSAARSSDPDGDAASLTRTWSLAAFPDRANTRFNGRCALTEPTDMAACFYADAPGRYQVNLGVRDDDDGGGGAGAGAGGAAPESNATTIVTVADDAPPCLRAEGTDLPARVADPAEAQTFSVVVADDGDPWPQVDPTNEYPRFTWAIRSNGGPWQVTAGYGATLELPARQLSIGDRAEIRVDVADRVVTRDLSFCGDAPTCSLSDGCSQRVTWTVDFR